VEKHGTARRTTYSAYALYAEYLRLQTQTRYMYYWLLSHDNYGYVNASHYHVLLTMSVMFISTVCRSLHVTFVLIRQELHALKSLHEERLKGLLAERQIRLYEFNDETKDANSAH